VLIFQWFRSIHGQQSGRSRKAAQAAAIIPLLRIISNEFPLPILTIREIKHLFPEQKPWPAKVEDVG
jgi:hypothetical protein